MEIIISLISIAILAMVVSFSYAYIKLEKQEKDVNVLGTDCIKLEMEEETDALYLTKAYPMTDENGAKTDPFIFKLRNDCGVGVNYEIHLRVEDTEEEQIAAKNIATSVDGEEKVKLTNKVSTEEEPEEYKINSKELTLNPYETVEHNVRIWLDEDAGNETQNKTFKSKVIIEAVQNQTAMYTEKILNGADPVLYNTSKEPIAMLTANGEETTNNDTLVPVEIDETTGKVTKADVTKEWYDYETKKWANAVILVDNSKADTIQPGEEIDEKDIESYFVWIPKYRYKLFNLEKYESTQEASLEDKGANIPIEIEFGLEDTTNDKEGECTTPNKSGDNGTCKKDDWMTHPAFTAFPNSHGMWVGKFETGYNGADGNIFTEIKDGKATCKNDVNIENTSKIIIKPNSYSWRCINVGNAYKNSYEYERELDSHMMKNTEWGAVAYLTQSAYGRCENGSCKEVSQNKNTNHLTGYQLDSSAYPNSKEASTTGNNSGIFDMIGGAWEQVMGVMKEQNSESLMWSQSGLSVINDKRFYDVYNYATNTEHWERKILGDATGEMGPFQKSGNDYISSYFGGCANFVGVYDTYQNSWFYRGGYLSDNNAGVFAFGSSDGNANNVFGFRIVLTPTNEAM